MVTVTTVSQIRKNPFSTNSESTNFQVTWITLPVFNTNVNDSWQLDDASEDYCKTA